MPNSVFSPDLQAHCCALAFNELCYSGALPPRGTQCCCLSTVTRGSYVTQFPDITVSMRQVCNSELTLFTVVCLLSVHKSSNSPWAFVCTSLVLVVDFFCGLECALCNLYHEKLFYYYFHLCLIINTLQDLFKKLSSINQIQFISKVIVVDLFFSSISAYKVGKLPTFKQSSRNSPNFLFDK